MLPNKFPNLIAPPMRPLLALVTPVARAAIVVVAGLSSSFAFAVQSDVQTEVLKTHRDFAAPLAVPHSGVRDQGKSGFCWAYSTTAMLEAHLLRERGIRVDLSEEYIGFFHVYDQLLKMAPSLFEMEKTIPDPESTAGAFRDLLNGAAVTFFFHPSEGAPDLNLGMNLIEKYGIVPESAFRFKAEKGLFSGRIQGRVRRFINQVLRDPIKNRAFRKQNSDGTYSTTPLPKELLNELAKVYTNEMFSDQPTETADSLLQAYRTGFTFGGTAYEPKTFAQDLLGFDRAQYGERKVTAKNEMQRLEEVRRSLANGHAVQLAFVLYTGYTAAVTTGGGVLQPRLCEGKPCPPAGGHAVLIVNEARDANTNELAGFVIQNSWGPVGLDDRGSDAGEKGYQIVTLEYLRKFGSWSFMSLR